jgi:hypothetical protein
MGEKIMRSSIDIKFFPKLLLVATNGNQIYKKTLGFRDFRV